jgi:hypothetical protein
MSDMLDGFERPDLFKKITFALLIPWMILILAGMSQGGGYEARVQKSMDFCLGQTAFSGNTVERTVRGMGMNMNYCEAKARVEEQFPWFPFIMLFVFFFWSWYVFIWNFIEVFVIDTHGKKFEKDWEEFIDTQDWDDNAFQYNKGVMKWNENDPGKQMYTNLRALTKVYIKTYPRYKKEISPTRLIKKLHWAISCIEKVYGLHPTGKKQEVSFSKIILRVEKKTSLKN